jgi:hypothetical protein
MQLEDPDDKDLVSCLIQDEVSARFSGALITGEEGSVVLEGVEGFGDAFMQGQAAPQVLPYQVESDVLLLQKRAGEKLGPVRMEWVHDGHQAWVLQLHAGASVSAGRFIVPGRPKKWRTFEISEGLEALRKLIKAIHRSNEGLELVGNIGITSHIADVLRRANIPSKIRR